LAARQPHHTNKLVMLTLDLRRLLSHAHVASPIFCNISTDTAYNIGCCRAFTLEDLYGDWYSAGPCASSRETTIMAWRPPSVRRATWRFTGCNSTANNTISGIWVGALYIIDLSIPGVKAQVSPKSIWVTNLSDGKNYGHLICPSPPREVACMVNVRW
jgi:hypothetical protein